MTDQTFRFPRFFVTAPSPCPYLPGKMERKVFTELRGEDAVELNEALSRIGFRRSQNVVYRPSCEGCNACVSVRVLAQRFAPSQTQRRIMRRNDDIEVSVCEPWTTPEQFDLLRAYLGERHPDGGMTRMDAYDYAEMVEQTPVNTLIIEYREPMADGRQGRLIGCCLTDRQADGLSMVYSFFDPAHPARSGLGTFIIMDHIRQAAAAGLDYVYLGYWIEGCERMSYKTRFRPIERLTTRGWKLVDAVETAA
ncbi:arginyltransferase [Sphingosinicella microcystinivorans]|uniref:arginyltransferase n=1 Tax=Sphingosinicella microcystinivorans TaxID=335406 RepID=UPI001C6C7565|nr:arginyltransferase [Sphingosinicella microcystinivorans]MBW7946203.1 arginyltransferase [Sphingomonadaceae bacterium]WBX83682.1 arginyltransferase [Sphingosinicella microcystinivorans]